jgi:phosphohistidine phosphatase SixA
MTSRKTISLLLIPIFLSSFLLGVFATQVTDLNREAKPLDGYKITPNSDEKDLFWANEILKGERKFILWFRHGEREKWTGTVTVFDYFDVSNNDQKFQKNWKPAVCLTPKGLAESQIVGATFRELKIDVSKVVSSPSCRAKETAIEAFGGFDEAWIEILHPTAVNSDQQKIFSQNLKLKIDRLLSSASKDKGVVVVTGHGNTLPYYSENLFISSEIANWTLSELGFVVIEVTPEGLKARHSFVEFYQFANAVLTYRNLTFDGQ